MRLTIYCNFHEQALYDALMRQDELLAYIDRQDLIKFRVCYCSSTILSFSIFRDINVFYYVSSFSMSAHYLIGLIYFKVKLVSPMFPSNDCCPICMPPAEKEVLLLRFDRGAAVLHDQSHSCILDCG